MPWTVLRLALTAYTWPANVPVKRYCKGRPPIRLGSSDAPITATDLGSRSLDNGRRVIIILLFIENSQNWIGVFRR